MTAAAQDPEEKLKKEPPKKPEKQPDYRASRTFAVGLLAVALTILAAGTGGFWYLTANSPLNLLTGGDRPIAAATAFVPTRSPFALFLLTPPQRLIALQQALARPEQRRQTRREISQIEQSLLENTGLDYSRDIQPWVGSEITFALTDRDLDFDSANGQQPGYLLALEIAPGQQQQACEFLQLLWQQQSLAGNPPRSQQISGVRLLYDDPPNSQQLSRLNGKLPTLTAASALAGDQFVIFANDIRVLRRSIRAAQTATNLVQNRAYRQAANYLPEQRIGLAYLNTADLEDISGAGEFASAKPKPKTSFTAISLGVTRTGLVANAQLLNQPPRLPATDASATEGLSAPVDALRYLPADSAIALASQDLSQLEPALAAAGLPSSVLPDFLYLRRLSPGGDDSGANASVSAQTPSALAPSLAPSLWDWAAADYGLAQIGSSHDWILAVARDAAGVAGLDEAAVAQGYSIVPVSIGEDEAIAWTRFSVRPQSRSAASNLETEILGLHLQQGDYEIFASSPAAMESALAAPKNPLLSAKRFTQAIAPLSAPNDGYLYLDWPAIAPAAKSALPALSLIDVAAHPFVSHIQTLAAVREGESASVFIQLSQAAEPAAP